MDTIKFTPIFHVCGTCQRIVAEADWLLHLREHRAEERAKWEEEEREAVAYAKAHPHKKTPAEVALLREINGALNG